MMILIIDRLMCSVIVFELLVTRCAFLTALEKKKDVFSPT